ncbi:MAG: hypothetical protein EOM31_07900 [Bacteroidia bacterium]|nr:hypothetical protein [Bacteroidia bacterium]
MKLSLLAWTPALLLGLFTSCVNQFSESEEERVPISFKASILSSVSSRVAGNAFEAEDSVGVFAWIESDTREQERLASNLQFNYVASKGEFMPHETLYFPEKEVGLTLVSYYPYSTKEVDLESAALKVGVKADQREKGDLVYSDFLVARKQNVQAKEAISLSFVHQFSKLRIHLVVPEGVDPALLKSEKPIVGVEGFYTAARYEVATNELGNLSDVRTLKPFASWTWNEEKRLLAGAEVVVIPQKIVPEQQWMSVEVAGVQYQVALPADVTLAGGKVYDLNVRFNPSEKFLSSHIKGAIGEWEEDRPMSGETTDKQSALVIDRLSFAASDSYRVLVRGKVVAEVCREYLLADNIDSRAIVAYPVDETGVADLLHGTVLKLFHPELVGHGGTVSWNVTENSLAYAPDDKPVAKVLYWDKGLKMVLADSGQGEPLQLMTKCYEDKRGGVVTRYPIVKIGTQYWLRDNLSATMYLTGEELVLLPQMAKGAEGYLVSENGKYLFYAEKVVNKGGLLPKSVAIPTWKDWNRLKTYVKNRTSVLKGGKWLPLKEEVAAMPYSNETGFSAEAAGMYIDSYQTAYQGRYVAYWTLNETGSCDDLEMYLSSGLEGFDESGHGDNKAFVIRCICR